jgi:hypothetical protein
MPDLKRSKNDMAKITRPPAVAGMFYPSDPDELKRMVHQYLDDADPPALTSVRALIAPHAGYPYSGPVAGYAYKLLTQKSAPPNRIFILGPSHRSWFPGVAAADVDAFRTPIGEHPVDRAYIQDLAASSDIVSAISTPHEPEHCLEVQYPFLQIVCPNVPTVPILFGEVDPQAVGSLLNESLGENDVVIVSSDLSHYHSNTTAHTLDQELLDALLASDPTGVAQGEACGEAPIRALMTIAEDRGWKPHLLDYRTSGDTTGNKSQVVGYSAVAYTEES